MKKTLLLSAAALATALCASADTGVFPDVVFQRISPNGQLIAGEYNEEVNIYDVATGETYTYSPDEGMASYTIGNGNCISNTGIVLGSTSIQNNGAYWKAGKWYDLDSSEKGSTLASGITPDGRRIVGSVLPPDAKDAYSGLMLQPIYWDVKDDGTYSEIKYLPFPDKDFAGLTPQYVTAVSVSDDGKTVVGQIRDCVGMFQQPIVYREAADGSWSYELVSPELLNPTNRVVDGAAAGEEPEYPDPLLYMDEEEQADFQKAIDEWAAGGYEGEYPLATDYMSDESIEAYKQGINTYNAWVERWNTFMEEQYSMLFEDGAAQFLYNSVCLSPDGKYYGSADEQIIYEGWSRSSVVTNYRFDLSDNTYKGFHSDTYNPYVNQMFDNGSMLAATAGFGVARVAYYISEEGVVEPLEDYFAVSNPAYAAFMKNNMVHPVESYDWDTGEFLSEEKMCSGIPYATPDMSRVITTLDRNWEVEDEDDNTWVYSYLIDSNTTGIVDAAADAVAAVKIGALRGGVITLTGAVSNLAVYDMSGRRVFASAKPGLSVSTGLASGVYVVRANAAGRQISAKVAF